MSIVYGVFSQVLTASSAEQALLFVAAGRRVPPEELSSAGSCKAGGAVTTVEGALLASKPQHKGVVRLFRQCGLHSAVSLSDHLLGVAYESDGDDDEAATRRAQTPQLLVASPSVARGLDLPKLPQQVSEGTSQLADRRRPRDQQHFQTNASPLPFTTPIRHTSVCASLLEALPTSTCPHRSCSCATHAPTMATAATSLRARSVGLVIVLGLPTTADQLIHLAGAGIAHLTRRSMSLARLTTDRPLSSLNTCLRNAFLPSTVRLLVCRACFQALSPLASRGEAIAADFVVFKHRGAP
eukprot:1653149-Pleurochrysis_carterae.AAC.3